MSNSASNTAVSREICIAFDSREISADTLDTIVLLAQRLNTGLMGLFMEDLLLQQVAALPFTTEVVKSTGEERGLFADALKQRAEQHLAKLRQKLMDASQAQQVQCRFDVRQDMTTVRSLFSASYDIYLPARKKSQPLNTRRGNKFAFDTVKLFFDGGPQSFRALDLVNQLLTSGMTRSVYLVTDRTVPASLITELASQGARVYLNHTHGDTASLLNMIVDGPGADLQLLPVTLLEQLDDKVLEHSLSQSRAEATYVVT